jgi:hypothetical protein
VGTSLSNNLSTDTVEPRVHDPELHQSKESPSSGLILRKAFMSRVGYCCWVIEDQNSATSNPASSDNLASSKKLANDGGQLTAMPNFQTINMEALFTREFKPCEYIELQF